MSTFSENSRIAKSKKEFWSLFVWESCDSFWPFSFQSQSQKKIILISADLFRSFRSVDFYFFVIYVTKCTLHILVRYTYICTQNKALYNVAELCYAIAKLSSIYLCAILWQISCLIINKVITFTALYISWRLYIPLDVFCLRVLSV